MNPFEDYTFSLNTYPGYNTRTLYTTPAQLASVSKDARYLIRAFYSQQYLGYLATLPLSAKRGYSLDSGTQYVPTIIRCFDCSPVSRAARRSVATLG